MISAPLISVIVPVYNTHTFLRECIESILCQKDVDTEIILVNDASEDGSEIICHEYADRFPNVVKAIDIPHSGPSVSRNIGIMKASGKYLCFVDSDDTLIDNALHSLLSTLEKFPKVGISVGQLFTNHPHRIEKKREFVVDSKCAIRNTLYQKPLYHSSAAAKLYRKEIFNHMDTWFVPGRQYEDLEVFPRLYLAAGCVAFTSEQVYHYRQHPSSFIHKWSDSRIDALWATEKLEQYVRGFVPDAIRAAQARRFSAAYNMYLLCSKNGRSDVCEKCLTIIKRLRKQMLCDRNVRIKNKFGALLSYILVK